MPTVTASTRQARRSLATAAATRRTCPGTSSTCLSARPGPWNNTVRNPSSASPPSHAQRPKRLGTASGDDNVRLAHQRRSASGAREFVAVPEERLPWRRLSFVYGVDGLPVTF